MIRVRAIAPGFYGMYRRPGEKDAEGNALDVFEIADESELGTWMERVSPPSQTYTKGDSSPAQVTAPSTHPQTGQIGLDDILAIIADDTRPYEPDELTDKGFLRKSALEKRLKRPVPQGVFLSYIKHVTEQRQLAN